MKWETWHGELEQLLHTVQLRTRMFYHCNLAYMQLFGLKNFLTNSRFLYSSSSGRVERRALVARKAATAGLGSKLAVPAEFKAMQSLSFTVSLSMLARRSLFSSVWQDITRSVIMLWGHVTRNVWISLFSTEDFVVLCSIEYSFAVILSWGLKDGAPNDTK